MRTVFTKFQLMVVLILAGFSVAAQTPNVIIANGGQFEFAMPYADHATIGAYNPTNKQYWVFDTIQVESVQDIAINGNYGYLAATDSILKYDLTTYEKVGQAYFAGIRSLSVHDTLLFAGRYFGTGAFLQVFHTNTLDSLFSIPEINNTVYDVAIVGDSAYVPYNALGTVDQFPPFMVFNDTLGKIAVVDLTTQSFVRDIELDTMGAGAKEIFNYNDQLFTVCEINGVIAHYDPINDTVIYDAAGVSGGIAQTDSIIYLNLGSGVGSYDVKNSQVVNNSIVTSSAYVAGALDILNDEFYLNTTDYSSYGKSFIYDVSGTLIDSVEVNVSPEAIGIIYQANNLNPIAMTDYLELTKNDATIDVEVTLNDFDPNGDALNLSILDSALHGDVSISGTEISYTVDTDYIGNDSLQYEICDGSLCDSAWVMIMIKDVSGIDFVSQKEVTIFPNPTNGIIQVSGVENGAYSVLDIDGRIIEQSIVANNGQIDLSQHPSGVYFIQLMNTEEVSTVRVIKF